MNRTLSDWLERWLGIGQAQAGEGTAWSLDHAWSWAPWLTLLFCALACAWVIGLYAREGGEAGRGYRLGLAALRLLAMAVVMFMIASVVISLERTGLPYVVVAVDTSGSMGTVDRHADEAMREALTRRVQAVGLEELTRLNLAKSVLLADRGALLTQIERQHKLKLYFLAEAAQPQPGDVTTALDALRHAEPTGEATRLGQGLRTVLNDLRGTPPAAIVLLTDGVTTDGESLSDAAAYARRKRVPLFCVGVGDEVQEQDVEVSDLLVDEVVFVDEIVNFDAKLTTSGYEGQPIEVLLRQKDREEPLARATVMAGADGQPQRVRLTYRPTEVGEFEYTVEVAPLPGELQVDNNRRACLVSVRKEQIRVLYVQAYPSFEFRYLKNMLERNPTIELKTVLQEADPEYSEADKTALRVFPSRRETLFEQDVILFGDVNPSFLSSTSLEHLSEFVTEKGGGLAILAGPRYTPQAYRHTPLAALVPVEAPSAGGTPEPGRLLSDGFLMEPTELGLTSPPLQLGDSPEQTAEIWRGLAPLYWFQEAARLRPGALVWAEHPQRLTEDGRRMPLVVLQYAGAGKVLYHATDETWRWRLRVGDVYFARYWVQSIRYLSRLKLLGQDRQAVLTTDRREYRRGEAVRLRVRFSDERTAPAADDGVTVMLEHAGHPKTQLKLTRHGTHRGVFEGEFNQPAEGSYHAWVVVPTLEGKPPGTDFLVVAPPGELARTRLDVAELTRASEVTKGRYYRVASAHTLARDLPAGRQIPLETLPPIVLWNRWPLLLALVLLLSSEWWLRKRRGML